MAKNRSAGTDDQRRVSVGLMASIVVVAGVIVLALVVILSGPGSKPSASPNGGDGASGGATASSSPAGWGCTPGDNDQSLPVAAPAVTWSIVNTVALPASQSAGPLRTDGVVASCYAHTPRGALLAALNLFYRVAVEAPGVTVVQDQVVPGVGAAALEAQLKTVTQPVQPGDLAQIAGYRVVSYTADTTVVTLVNGSSQSNTLKASDVTVQWNGGDWKLVVAPDGSISTPGTHITSLAGYTPFGGV